LVVQALVLSRNRRNRRPLLVLAPVPLVNCRQTLVLVLVLLVLSRNRQKHLLLVV
jgi:hypothetical protein